MELKLDRRSFILGWIPGILNWPGTSRQSRVNLCRIEFRILRYGRSPRRYLVIHGDEDTARDVLASYMFDHEGTGYIVTGSMREVEIQGAKIDPNRLFSREGAERSLRALNSGMDPEKVIAILNFLDHGRNRLLRRIVPKKGSRLFALHNNRNYSIQDEIAASDQVSVPQPQLPRDFFLCTNPRDFEILKQSPFNVVLQSKPDPDDGSLSRLAARIGFRYINLECAIGDYEGQQERLRWLDDHVP